MVGSKLGLQAGSWALEEVGEMWFQTIPGRREQIWKVSWCEHLKTKSFLLALGGVPPSEQSVGKGEDLWGLLDSEHQRFFYVYSIPLTKSQWSVDILRRTCRKDLASKFPWFWFCNWQEFLWARRLSFLIIPGDQNFMVPGRRVWVAFIYAPWCQGCIMSGIKAQNARFGRHLGGGCGGGLILQYFYTVKIKNSFKIFSLHIVLTL